MRNRFDAQLEQLNDELVSMGSMIEKAIQAAVSALVNKDEAKAKEAIEYDNEVDRQERDIESLCMKLLMSQQPVAKDLRVISSALKMITDMERIGDQSADISEITIMLSKSQYIMDMDDILEMAKETILMVIQSVDAFVRKDVELAKGVIAHDDIVDDLFIKIKREIIDYVRKNSENGEEATDFLMIAKYFERIGDHATNIAEWVIYSISGERP